MRELSSDDRGMGRSRVENIGRGETRSGKMDDEMRVEKEMYMRQTERGKDI